MKQPAFSAVLGCLLALLASTGHFAAASSSAASECRKEAQDYGFTGNDLNDYINGCLASRGEPIPDEPTEADYVPPDEQDVEPEMPTGDDEAAQ